jgi:hypothetical protein
MCLVKYFLKTISISPENLFHQRRQNRAHTAVTKTPQISVSIQLHDVATKHKKGAKESL